MPESDGSKKTVAYCDGCFDFLHYGHANQVRQAKETADYLVVGTHTDKDITNNKKCAPIFLQEERYRLIKALKWVDKVIYDAPFSPTVAFLDENNCDFSVHGNDLSLNAEGGHTYADVKKAGRYVECRRMPGISTTDIIQRLAEDDKSQQIDPTQYSKNTSPWTRGYPFMPTTELLAQFAGGIKQKLTDKVVYVAGTFDLFHIGHLSFLEEAAKLGTYLLVGVHDDTVINEFKKHTSPILSLHERVLTVLSYKCVSNVLIGAPYIIDSDLLDQFKVDIVCHGSQVPIGTLDPYVEPKRRGKFRLIDSKSDVTTETIFQRVFNRRHELEQRNEKKELKERNAYDKMIMVQKIKHG